MTIRTQNDFPHNPTANVRAKECARYLGVSHSTYWRWVRSGIIPKPTKISPGISVWSAGTIHAVREKLMTAGG